MPGRYYTTDFISTRQARTPEGFLVLYDVALARTGQQLYHESELRGWGIKGDAHGVVTVTRMPEDVFAEDAVASFEAKDVSDDHPFDGSLITPDTYQRDSVGVVVNVRRAGDFLVGDMFVKHASAIRAVQDGKRQVSCGYTCDYAQTGPGTARQFNIRGNHVALVDVGRCGDQCSIGDHAMPQPSKLRALKARALAALATKDEATLKKIVDEMPDEGEDDEGASSRSGGEIHVHNHINAPGAAGGDSREGDKMPTKDEDKEERMKKLEEDSASLRKAVDGIKSTVDSIAKKIAKDEGKLVEGVEIPPAGEQGVDSLRSTDAKGADESEEEYKKRMEDRRRTGDTGRRIVRDSAHLVDDFEQVVADADVLVPGIRVGTFDAKAPANVTMDALCALRRRALNTAYQTTDGAQVIEQVLPREYRGKPNVFGSQTMDCASVSAVFAGAVALTRASNNGRQGGLAGYERGTFDAFASTAKVPTIAELQKQQDEFWAKHKA